MTYLVRELVRPTIDTVVGSVQASFWEPDDVPCFKCASSDILEGTIPMQGLSRNL